MSSASSTVTRFVIAAQSPPWQPAFMNTPPPTEPGTPTKMCNPASPRSAVRRAAIGAGSPAPMVAVAPSTASKSSPLPSRMTSASSPSSGNSRLEPRPTTNHGTPLAAANATARATSSVVEGSSTVAGPPIRYVE